MDEENKKKKKGNPNIKDHGFKPGQTGNAAGRPKMPEELQKANKLSAKKFIEYVNKYINMNQESLKEDLKRPQATMLELLVGGMIARAVKDQDPARANFILDRTIGKVIEKMEIDVAVVPKPTIIQRHDGTEIELGHKMVDVKTIEAETVEKRYELTDKNGILDESNS